MAKPYKEITKTDFRNLYNITKILVSKEDVMDFLRKYKDDGTQAVAIGSRKKRVLTINEKLDIIIERLDRHDELFRAHGWIK
ncbi:MAG: hypothetical protein MJ233_03075 [Mycoplasmoidaceae bacterium]|nr:hypothetical protein [Mycoplasmoidaceae bacterium]